jgi:hypothetical protein
MVTKRRVVRKAVTATETVDSRVVNNVTKEVVSVGTDNETSHRTVEVAGEVAHVTVSGKITRNLGDYNSAQVTVGITRPCRDTDTEIDRVYTECSDWVEQKITLELGKV